jgi:large subunit ribosomal protein L5
VTPRLKERYNAEVKDALFEELGLANRMKVPTFSKIVVNMGLGDAVDDAT